MNREFVLNNTASYDEWLIRRLGNPEEAMNYIDAAIELYNEDNDANALFIAVVNVTMATARIEELLEDLLKDIDITRDSPYTFISPVLKALPETMSSLGYRIQIERYATPNTPVSA